MKNELTHTPTPWGYAINSPMTKALVLENDGSTILAIDNNVETKRFRANIQYAVRAVNSHDALVEALKGLMWRFDTDDPADDETDIKIARAALKLAEGGEQPMNLKNLSNEYQRGFPDFNETPKSVIAAIAFSFALRISEDNFAQAAQMIIDEWETLHQNKIVPQKPPKRSHKERSQS